MNDCQSFLSFCILPQKVSLVSIVALSHESLFNARHCKLGYVEWQRKEKGAVLHSWHFVSKTGSEFLLWFRLNGRLLLKEWKYRKNNINAKSSRRTKTSLTNSQKGDSMLLTHRMYQTLTSDWPVQGMVPFPVGNLIYWFMWWLCLISGFLDTLVLELVPPHMLSKEIMSWTLLEVPEPEKAANKTRLL